MRRSAFFIFMFLIPFFILSDGCKKKDEDKVLNKITISGNTNTQINGEYTPESGIYYPAFQTSCASTTYQSFFSVRFTNNYQMQVYFYQPVQSATIPTGTFQPQTTSECDPGFYGDFFPIQVKIGGYHFSGGTIIVAKTGDIYDINLNIQLDTENGGGTLTGNFNGPLDLGATK